MRAAGSLIGRRIRQLDLPETTLVAAVRRGGHVIFPRGEHALQTGDRVTIVGPPEAIHELDRRWRSTAADP